jgi:hypothetical protein
MPSKIILCRDCEAETTTIEQTGNWKVTSCAPAPGEANKPAATQRCVIEWERARVSTATIAAKPIKKKQTCRPKPAPTKATNGKNKKD